VNKLIVTQEWLDAFGLTRNILRVRGNKLVFVGKRGRKLLCRLNYLAKRNGISSHKFIIDAIVRGCGA
jgi:hypothetical protein